MSAFPNRADAPAPGRADSASLPLPTGTVTFAFTDIEDSTKRWEHDRDAMQDAVRRHDALVRAAILAHGGHVFKTMGDAFCTAFARPENAVAAMLAAQRALAAEDFSATDGLRVRAAIHTGTADERDGDYFGPALNRVARLLAVGHGGQVLLSGVTADLVQGELPAQCALRDLGEHRLKDLARPEYVYQLVGPDLAPHFPPLRSLATLPNNLPLQLTSFIGREAEIAKIVGLFASHRLVTIVGSGGVGKTRTSLQIGADLLDAYPDGVWFVELAPLASAEYISTTIVEAVGIELRGDDPRAALVRALRGKHALLIFDNCEHLVGPAAKAIAAILQGCPQIAILASSRQGLGITGEATYRMPSLGVQATQDGTLDAASARLMPAVALFIDRATSANPDFTFTEEDAPVVMEICRSLDGIALAIELAATRIKVLSPHQLRDRLNERFRMLTGGGRDRLPRQQTLRALIDWSHDLLDARERIVFRRLGVFANGFTLDGAVAVACGEDIEEFELFDLLTSLIDKSLVITEPSGKALGYRLLESTRAYAREKLEQSGERVATRDRHARFFAALFGKVSERYEADGKPTALEALIISELEDLREAITHAFEMDPALAADLVLATTLRHRLNLRIELRRDVERALSLVDPEDVRRRGWLALTAARISGEGFELSAQRYALHREALEVARSAGDPRLLVRAVAVTATVGALNDPIGVRELLDEFETLRKHASPWDISTEMEAKAFLLESAGDHAACAQAIEELLRRYRAADDRFNVATYALNLAEMLHADGQSERAAAVTAEVLPALRTSRYRDPYLMAAANLCGYDVVLDWVDDAIAMAPIVLGSRNAAPEFGQLPLTVLGHVAPIIAAHGRPALAAQLSAYLDAEFARGSYVRESIELSTRERLLAILAVRIAPVDAPRLEAEGRELTFEAAVTTTREALDAIAADRAGRAD